MKKINYSEIDLHKMEYISNIIDIIIYSFQKENVVELNNGKKLNKEELCEFIFGIKKNTYEKFNQRKINLSTQIKRYDKKNDNVHILKLKKEGWVYNYDEQKVLEMIKKALIIHKADLNYREDVIDKINNYNTRYSLLYYVFTDAYKSSIRDEFINVDINNLKLILEAQLNQWEMKNSTVNKVDVNINDNTNTFISIDIKYDFGIKEERKFYYYQIYVYTGKSLDMDINIIDTSVRKVRLICILNPYNNWIEKEQYIEKEIYFSSIKKQDIYSFECMNNFIANLNIKDSILLNRIAKVVIDKIDYYSELILKKYLVESKALAKNPAIEAFELKLLNSYKSKNTDILIIGEYDLDYLKKIKFEFNKVYNYSNSVKYINEMKDMCKRYDIDIEFHYLYLGIADYILSSSKKMFDVILISTGQISFFNSLKKYLVYFNYILKDDGIIVLSAYNSNYNADGISFDNLRKNVNLVLENNLNRAKYCFQHDLKCLSIPCKSYNYNELHNLLSRFFSVVKIHSFPMLLLISTISKGITNNLLAEMDTIYSLSEEGRSNDYNGYYLYFLLKKGYKENTPDDGFNIINNSNIECLKHKATFNKTVQMHKIKAIEPELTEKMMLKVVLLKEKGNDKKAVVVTYLSKFLSKSEQNNWCIKLNGKDYILLSVLEINQLGLEVGNISPFILDSEDVEHFYDEILDIFFKKYNTQSKDLNVYFGSNDCTKTYKMDLRMFIKLLQGFGYKSVAV